ncbi:MAG: hypothetical protein NVV59_19565 [Chitinophagaceae bacterium]|nr:hypothetical protein [Chitinophagaceae bacterium]
MRKLLLLAFVACLGLVACIETESNTTVNADGSGSIVSVIDMSQMMDFLASQKSDDDKEVVKLDSVIHFKTISDTAKGFTARQKELLRPLQLRMQLNSETNEMRFTITSPFKKMEEVQELNELLASNQFDKYFDQAFQLAGLDDKKDESADEVKAEESSSNIFGSLFPDYYVWQYKKGQIACKTDPKKVDAFRQRWNAGNDDDEDARQMVMEMVSFTNRFVIPANAKDVKGEKLEEGSSRKEWIQKGTLLDLIENPAKYEYSITY